MHSNPIYYIEDHVLQEALLSEVGFGAVIAAIDGDVEANAGGELAVVHVPLLSTGDGAVQFHLGRTHRLAPHLDGRNAKILVSGPDAYISPRWTGERDAVPTWNYVSLEISGRVRRMDQDGLEAMLEALIAREEGRTPPGIGAGPDAERPYSRADMGEEKWRSLQSQLIGFELEGGRWDTTFKLSQEKSAPTRANIADGLEASGSTAIANLMRSLGL